MTEAALFDTDSPAEPAGDSPGAAAEPPRPLTHDERVAEAKARGYTQREVVQFLIAATDEAEFRFAANVWDLLGWGFRVDVREHYGDLEPPPYIGARLPWTWMELLGAKRRDLQLPPLTISRGGT